MKEPQGCRCSTRLEEVCVRKKDQIILDHITLEVHHGEILALIGLNGAGKTTLIRTILGQIHYEGTITFLDSNGKVQPRPRIGYMPQTLEIDRGTPLTVADFFCAGLSASPVWFRRSEKALKQAEEMLKKVHASGLMNKRIGELSGGELQRVLLAFTLSPMPDLLLLDEPVSAVDHRGAQEFYSLLAELRSEFHMPIILVSHDLRQVAEFAGRVAYLDKGLICVGEPKEVFRDEKVRKAFGLDEWRAL